MEIKKISLQIIIIFLIAFSLNFIWESYHSILFYTCCTEMPSPEHLRLMSYVSTIDALLILLGYFIISLKSGFSWPNNRNKNNYITFSVIVFIFALWIEYRGVYILKKCSYNELMPILFGFGLSPLIQLITTGLLTFFISKRLLASSNNRKI